MNFILDEIMFMDQFNNSFTMPKCLTFKPTFFLFFFGKISLLCNKKRGHEYTKRIILFSMTYSQIWLSPLVDDCQSTYAH
jgi:hypothetical protein